MLCKTDRLDVVAVTTSGELVRAYKLDYEYDAGMGTLNLVSVQQFGSDAVISDYGDITSGSALPPSTFTYDSPVVSPPFSLNYSETFWHMHKFITGDWNGDGRMDVCLQRTTSSSAAVSMYLADENGEMYMTGFSEDWPSNRYTLYPGDWDGDGKTDLAVWDKESQFDDTTGWYCQKIMIYRSSGNSMIYTSTTLAKCQHDPEAYVGDWNGDGRSDLAFYNLYPDSIGPMGYVFLSNGDWSFTRQRSGIYAGCVDWHTFPGCRLYTGDWNGDGKTSFVLSFLRKALNGDSYCVPFCALDFGLYFYSNVGEAWYGNQFEHDASHIDPPYYPYPWANDYEHWAAVTGDWNGDGKTDMLFYHKDNDSSAGALPSVAYINTGAVFKKNSLKQWGLSPPEGDFDVVTGDWNGDGKTDIVFLEEWPGENSYFYISLGYAFSQIEFNPRGRLVAIGDWNGDGRDDLWFVYGHYAEQYLSNYGTGLMTSHTNSLGGVTTIQYKPTSALERGNLPVGLTLQTVSKVAIDDGRGNQASTEYFYEDAKWSNDERLFLGFSKVKAVLDDNGNYTETEYLLRDESIAKPIKFSLKNNQDQFFNYSEFEYDCQGDGDTTPFTSLLSVRKDYTCNLGDNCRQTLSEYEYDQYGNTLEIKEMGDTSINGDERTIIFEFSYNTDNYIVGLPGLETIHAGSDNTGKLLALQFFYYDGATDSSTPPEIGNLTQVSWPDPTPDDGSQYISIKMAYDSYGNLTEQTDELGNRTDFTYDPVYHLFQETQRNALDQEANTSWNTLFGKVETTTDLNNVDTVYKYDVFGRPKTETDPAGTVTTYHYNDFGNPVNQHVMTEIVGADGTSTWTKVYKDGLGRDYKTIDKGNITRDLDFDKTTDRISGRSLAYLPGENILWTTFDYDPVGRTTKITHPDNSYIESRYLINESGEPYTAIFDETGNEKQYWKDARGNLVTIKEKLDGQYLDTIYEYDLMGNPVTLIDSSGNVIVTATWDLLGRKTTSFDADMGTWIYGYDDAGRLITVLDAKNQQTTYTYDGLGRIKKAVNHNGQETKYYYDEPGPFEGQYTIGRLTYVEYPGGAEYHSYDSRGNEIWNLRGVEKVSVSFVRYYNGLGQIKSIIYPDFEQVDMTYDNAGHLYSVTGNNGPYVNSMTWNARGQLKTMTYANNTSVTYDYGPERQWLDNAHLAGPNGTLYEVGYSYDNAARMKQSISTTNPLYDNDYTYDER